MLNSDSLCLQRLISTNQIFTTDRFFVNTSTNEKIIFKQVLKKGTDL